MKSDQILTIPLISKETAVLAQEDAEYIDYDYDETNYDVIQEYSGDPLSHAQSQIHFNSSNGKIFNCVCVCV